MPDKTSAILTTNFANPRFEPTWPTPRASWPCIICGDQSPGHVLIKGIGHEYVAQVCSSHTLWEVLAAQRDGHDLLNLVVSINDLDLAEAMTEARKSVSQS